MSRCVMENLQNVSAHYPYAEIPIFTVMPNHLHAVIVIDGDKIPMGNCRDAARRVSTGGTGETGKTVNRENNDSKRKTNQCRTINFKTDTGFHPRGHHGMVTMGVRILLPFVRNIANIISAKSSTGKCNYR